MDKELFEIRHCACENEDVSAREWIRSQTSATFNGTNLIVRGNWKNIKWSMEQIQGFGELLCEMSALC